MSSCRAVVNRINSLVLFANLFFCSGVACVDAQVYCGQSWKTGESGIVPVSKVIRIELGGRTKKLVVKGANGKKYLLSIAGATAGSPEALIEVTVSFEERGQRDVDLLSRSRDPLQDYFSFRDRPGWFYISGKDPNRSEAADSVLPFLTMRVIKIEGFFCVLEVSRYRLSPNRVGAFEFVEIRATFSNENSDCRYSDRVPEKAQ